MNTVDMYYGERKVSLKNEQDLYEEMECKTQYLLPPGVSLAGVIVYLMMKRV